MRRLDSIGQLITYIHGGFRNARAWVDEDGNIIIRLGDNAGARKVSFRDSDDVEVGYIDSEGASTFGGGGGGGTGNRAVLVPAIGASYKLGGVVLPVLRERTVYAQCCVDANYDTGLTITPIVLPPKMGALYFTCKIYGAAIGESYDTHSYSVGPDTCTLAANQVQEVTPAEGSLPDPSDLVANDQVMIEFTRHANDRQDSIPADIVLLGFAMTYQV